jgi:hypothetical protein|tara:strand:+ start:199 stop:441 length:243 start_codon:yes stop_codon:yes gene_type:complete
MAGQKMLTRRQMLGYSAASAATLALGGCQTKPDFLYVSGEASDFQRHLDNLSRFGSFDIGGVDYDFGDGTPLWGPASHTA